MKKIRLYALSLLALTTAGALASCGSKQPPTKPGVIFRANTVVPLEGGDSEEIDFKNTECAEVEVKDEKNLQYGKQDVVVTIRPKSMFTLKNYNFETWEPEGAPIKPYVGLGNPYNLYSYELVEDIAWTFEETENSKPFKEEYEITIKKEFFQKNIVIAYTYEKAKPFYTYDSNLYRHMFFDQNPLFGVNKNLYTIEQKKCDFSAGSKGATVTIGFEGASGGSSIMPNPLSNFAGFDAVPTVEEGTTTPVDYPHEHFAVYGVPKTTEGNADPQPVVISKYDPTIKDPNEQPFIPSVITSGISGAHSYKDSLSFFFKWDLLANRDSDLSAKYDRVYIEIGNPTIGSGDINVNYTYPTGSVTSYLDGFYDNASDGSGNKAVFDGNTITGEFAPKSYTTLSNIDIFDGKKSSISYAALFSINDSKVKQFNINIGNTGSKIEVDFTKENKSGILTDWRKERLGEAETELRCWGDRPDNIDDSEWVLVQLNPFGRKAGGIPNDLLEKENLYVLLATQEGAIGKYDDDTLNIEIEIPDQKYNLVQLSNTDYGTFAGGKGDFAFAPGEGAYAVDIPFYPAEQYSNSNFDVSDLTVTGDDDPTKNYVAQYFPKKEGKDYATIHVSNNKPMPVSDLVVTINLKPQTGVTLTIDESDAYFIGTFNSGSTEIVPDATGKTTVECDIWFNDRIKGLGHTVIPEVVATYCDEKIYVPYTPYENPTVGEADGKIAITLPGDGTFSDGDWLFISLKYAELNLTDESQAIGGFWDGFDLHNYVSLASVVGREKADGITFKLSETSTVEPFAPLYGEWGTARGTMIKGFTITCLEDEYPDGDVYVIEFESFTPIDNAEIISLTITTTPPPSL